MWYINYVKYCYIIHPQRSSTTDNAHPFQTIVFARLTAAAKASAVFGPTSRPYTTSHTHHRAEISDVTYIKVKKITTKRTGKRYATVVIY